MFCLSHPNSLLLWGRVTLSQSQNQAAGGARQVKDGTVGEAYPKGQLHRVTSWAGTKVKQARCKI